MDSFMVIYVIFKIESFSAHYVKEHNEHVSKERFGMTRGLCLCDKLQSKNTEMKMVSCE